MQIMESQVLFHLRQHGEGLPRVLLQLLLCSTASCFHLAQAEITKQFHGGEPGACAASQLRTLQASSVPKIFQGFLDSSAGQRG